MYEDKEYKHKKFAEFIKIVNELQSVCMMLFYFDTLCKVNTSPMFFAKSIKVNLPLTRKFKVNSPK